MVGGRLQELELIRYLRQGDEVSIWSIHDRKLRALYWLPLQLEISRSQSVWQYDTAVL